MHKEGIGELRARMRVCCNVYVSLVALIIVKIGNFKCINRVIRARECKLIFMFAEKSTARERTMMKRPYMWLIRLINVH